jgi:hypothetical protein
MAVVVEASPWPPMPSVSDDADLPSELRSLRDCASASAALERLLGVPVIAESIVPLREVAARELGRMPVDLLAPGLAEAVLTRTVRLLPPGDGRRAAWPVATSSLWLMVDRVPISIIQYLHATCLTLGQVIRLVGLPVTTERMAWRADPADRLAAALFGCPPGTPVLRRLMLVRMGERPVAVTDEAFSAFRRSAGRGRGGGRR